MTEQEESIVEEPVVIMGEIAILEDPVTPKQQEKSKKPKYKTIVSALKTLERSRWYDTAEGEAYLAEQAMIANLKWLRTQFSIGQLVWRDDVLDDPTLSTNGKIVNVCSKIVDIFEDSIMVEMMNATVDGEKVEEYRDWFGTLYVKGGNKSWHFYRLERHFSKKSGNIWWKVL